jgi:hypothetical protein
LSTSSWNTTGFANFDDGGIIPRRGGLALTYKIAGGSRFNKYLIH